MWNSFVCCGYRWHLCVNPCLFSNKVSLLSRIFLMERTKSIEIGKALWRWGTQHAQHAIFDVLNISGFLRSRSLCDFKKEWIEMNMTLGAVKIVWILIECTSSTLYPIPLNLLYKSKLINHSLWAALVVTVGSSSVPSAPLYQGMLIMETCFVLYFLFIMVVKLKPI